MKTFVVQLFGSPASSTLRLFDAPTAPHPIPAERPLSPDVIDVLIRDVESEYRKGAPLLADLGAKLYQFLDDPGHRWLNRVAGAGCAALHIDVDERLRHLPWELLHDGGHFLCGDPLLFTP
ncbi:MAG TPA: hypothetical protein VM694_17240, partial [Polyangium sp.]|nr:hypothetical protein [Polyangium sp.]